MASRRIFPFAMMKRVNEGIGQYDEELEKLTQCRIKALLKRKRMIREGDTDLDEVNKAIADVEVLISRVTEERDIYKIVQEHRHILFIELYKLSYRILEERRQLQSGVPLPLMGNVLPHLFATDLDARTQIVVKHLAFYCMQKNNYISRNPYQSIYGLLMDFYNPIKGLGEAILIMGYEYRDRFRNYIRRNYPLTRFLNLRYMVFVSTSLTHIFHEFYIQDAPYLSFLIVAAFAMELIYYIRDYEIGWKRLFIKFIVYKLCSVLSSDGFINSCGMEKLESYAAAFYQGHILAPPFDYLRSPLYQSRYPAEIPWDYLDENPRSFYDSPDVPPSRSMERLAALPAGTEARNIVEALGSPP